MEPLISIIVPIYQIDRYIGICIESIINQTYRNTEIILVDDGSSDRSGEICDLYSQKDKRIRVIHKSNGGLVSARKAGLEIATGEYVGYVDGDDWIEQRFYEDMVKTIVNFDSDIVIAGMSRDLFSVSSKISNKIPPGNYERKQLKKLKENMLIFQHLSCIGITTYVWNKLFKRKMLFKYQMDVDKSISIGEDAAVTYPYLMACNKVSIIDNYDYHYRQREDSMLKKTAAYSKEVIGLKKLYKYLLNSASIYGDGINYVKQIEEFILGICIIRSGGILKEIREEYSPYGKTFYGSNVVVYSAGTFGQQLIGRIKEKKYCNVVGWIDVDYKEYRRCCLNVDPISSIDFMEFDFVLVATIDGFAADNIRSDLLWRGIPENKILTINYPKSDKRNLLNMYLNIED